ncbi:Karyopherin transporter [Rhizophlyctis rosea]|uniref:Karyopherin transporter n=1 Tax=Rhizophlyctis rosea TaxID=64517 RepID=A0AAD5X4A6_9FUNG|nr:Karyopherin transporter [Rhizophlyctis rosea]
MVPVALRRLWPLHPACFEQPRHELYMLLLAVKAGSSKENMKESDEFSIGQADSKLPSLNLEHVPTNEMEAVLDFNEKLDVGLFDSVVQTFYSEPESHERFKAKVVLELFETHPNAFRRVNPIMQQSSMQESKILALGILNQRIKSGWKALPPEERADIKNYIVQVIIDVSSTDQALITNRRLLAKLNLTLVQILKQEWPHNWPSFIPEIVRSSKQNLALCENNMVILQLLSEEIFDFSAEQMTQAKTKNLKNQMCNEFSEVFQLCFEILQTAQQPSLVTATLETLRRFLNWIPLGYIFQTNLVEILEKFVENPITEDIALYSLELIHQLLMENPPPNPGDGAKNQLAQKIVENACYGREQQQTTQVATSHGNFTVGASTEPHTILQKKISKADTQQQLIIPSPMPAGIDSHTLPREPQEVTQATTQRIEELENQLIELKALKSWERQQLPEARQSEKQERNQRVVREKRERQKHTDFLNSIVSHATGMLEFREEQRKKGGKLGAVVKKFHQQVAKEEEKRLQRISQERLNAREVVGMVTDAEPDTCAQHDDDHAADDTEDQCSYDDEEGDEVEEDFAPPPPPSSYNRGRRTSVFAESKAPSLDKDYVKVAQRTRLKDVIRANLLFKDLDDEQFTDILNALVSKRVTAGEEVIRQGAVGDFFYVVEEGTLDVYMSRGGHPAVKVFDYGPNSSFGELALMYNAPSFAASVVATEDSVLWALDRVTFRRLLMENTCNRSMYVEPGEAKDTQTDENGIEHEIPGLKKGNHLSALNVEAALELPFYGSDALEEYVESTLGSGHHGADSRLLGGEDPNEWLAVNTVDFFNQINMLYGTITEFCTPRECPVMSAGPKYYCDGVQFKKPVKVSAPDYVNYVMEWVQKQLNDESLFPSNVSALYPKNFPSVVKAIFKRLFRVYAHIYHAHLEKIVQLGKHELLDDSFTRFVFFAVENGFVERRELARILTSDARTGVGAGRCGGVGALGVPSSTMDDERFQVYVTSTSLESNGISRRKTISFEVWNSMTVEGFERMVWWKFGMGSPDAKLFYRGRRLPNVGCLSDLDVHHGDTFFIGSYLHGGMPPKRRRQSDVGATPPAAKKPKPERIPEQNAKAHQRMGATRSKKIEMVDCADCGAQIKKTSAEVHKPKCKGRKTPKSSKSKKKRASKSRPAPTAIWKVRYLPEVNGITVGVPDVTEYDHPGGTSTPTERAAEASFIRRARLDSMFIKDLDVHGLLDLFRFCKLFRFPVRVMALAMKCAMETGEDLVDVDEVLANAGDFVAGFRQATEGGVKDQKPGSWDKSVYHWIRQVLEWDEITVDGMAFIHWLVKYAQRTAAYLVASTGVRDRNYGRNLMDLTTAERHILFHITLIPLEIEKGPHPETMLFHPILQHHIPQPLIILHVMLAILPTMLSHTYRTIRAIPSAEAVPSLERFYKVENLAKLEEARQLCNESFDGNVPPLHDYAKNHLTTPAPELLVAKVNVAGGDGLLGYDEGNFIMCSEELKDGWGLGKVVDFRGNGEGEIGRFDLGNVERRKGLHFLYDPTDVSGGKGKDRDNEGPEMSDEAAQALLEELIGEGDEEVVEEEESGDEGGDGEGLEEGEVDEDSDGAEGGGEMCEDDVGFAIRESLLASGGEFLGREGEGEGGFDGNVGLGGFRFTFGGEAAGHE